VTTELAVPDWTAVVGALIAVYAATLSTLQWIKNFRDERPRLYVTMSLGRIQNGIGDNEEKLFLNYVNVGKIPVTITSLPALRLNTVKDSKLVIHSSVYPLPHRLEPYAENKSWVNLKSLSRHINQDAVENGAEYWITGVVTDASGKEHKSTPYVFYRPIRRETEILVGTPDAAKWPAAP
jgi:hypothetical protein